MQSDGMDSVEARAFAEKWLPAWRGNQPEQLAAFYSIDALYSHPGVPAGVRGRAALVAYFRKLLGHNPHWVWTHRGSIPLQDGFLNLWRASVPVGPKVIVAEGRVLGSDPRRVDLREPCPLRSLRAAAGHLRGLKDSRPRGPRTQGVGLRSIAAPDVRAT